MTIKTSLWFGISFCWLPVLAVAAWAAGFMPFPTRPEQVGWSEYSSVGLDEPRIQDLILMTPNKAREKAKGALFGLGQWYCDPEHKLECRIYEVVEAPFFGLLSPNWILSVSDDTYYGNPIAFYGTYSACQFNKERRQKESDFADIDLERRAAEQHVKFGGRSIFDCVKYPQ